MKEIKEFKDIKYKKWASNIHAAKLRKLQDKTKARIESQQQDMESKQFYDQMHE